MFRALFFVLLLIALVWAFLHFYNQGELPFVGSTLGDAKTTASVKAALALHRDLSRRPLSVRTRDGVVLVTGDVASEDEKSQVEALVRSVDGVRNVDNLIRVVPELKSEDSGSERTLGEKLDDAALAAKVKGAFALHRELRSLDISVDVRDRTVYLEGWVDTEAQAALAREWAASVEGVQKVENLIRLTEEEDSPPKLAARVEAELARNDNLRGYNLRAVARDGLIVLEGNVRTGAERELAELLAERIAHKDSLRNDIRVPGR